MDKFILFLLRYAIHCAPKDEVKRKLKALREKQYQELGHTPEAAESSKLGKCHFDFYTTTDLAYCLWQYFNSALDWKRKFLARDSVNDETYKCGTRFTSDRSRKKKNEGDEDEDRDGMKLYAKVLAWVKKLKSLPDRELNLLRYCVNQKAIDLGLLKGYKVKSRPAVDWEDEEELGSVPVVELELDDEIEDL